MEEIKSLLVLWQNKKNNLYYHIGTLYYNGNQYTFEYTHHEGGHRKVGEAMRNGYRLLPAFPHLETVYTSDTLFAAFDRRIPSSDRVDFKEILQNLGLPAQADRMDILLETRGMLAGDSYSFQQPIRLSENRHLTTSFYINGMRHQQLPSNWSLLIQKAKNLKFIADNENSNDPYAVRIETGKGMMLGFVPAVYAPAIKSLLDHNLEFKISINDIRPDSAPQWWVSLSIEADLQESQVDFVNKTQLNGLVLQSA